MFILAGEHLHHEPLTYPSNWLYSVACSRHYIFIVESDPITVHLHDWQGREVGHWGQRDLDLQEQDEVQGIWWGHGDLLHLAVGEGINVTALHMYRVESQGAL